MQKQLVQLLYTIRRLLEDDDDDDNVRLTYTAGEAGPWRDPPEAPEVRQTSIALVASNTRLTDALASDSVTARRQRPSSVALTLV